MLDEARITADGRLVAGHFADRIALDHARLDLLERRASAASWHIPDWCQRLDAGALPMIFAAAAAIGRARSSGLLI